MSSFKVQVGPAQVAIHQGRTVLACEPDGTVPAHTEKGLYFNDTRIIGSWSVYADGQRWDLLSGSATSHDAMKAHPTNRKLDTASGPIAARTLGLVLARSVSVSPHGDVAMTYGNGRLSFVVDLPALDRRVGQPRPRRFPGIPDPVHDRLREHGLEGCGR